MGSTGANDGDLPILYCVVTRLEIGMIKNAATDIDPNVVAEGRASTSPGALTVHGPAGLRVEGLTVEWVAALVRALRA